VYREEVCLVAAASSSAQMLVSLHRIETCLVGMRHAMEGAHSVTMELNMLGIDRQEGLRRMLRCQRCR
jgi:hypothetical protein